MGMRQTLSSTAVVCSCLSLFPLISDCARRARQGIFVAVPGTNRTPPHPEHASSAAPLPPTVGSAISQASSASDSSPASCRRRTSSAAQVLAVHEHLGQPAVAAQRGVQLVLEPVVQRQVALIDVHAVAQEDGLGGPAVLERLANAGATAIWWLSGGTGATAARPWEIWRNPVRV
ncbi:putative glutaredoxin protein [Hordeum vulgare]|nr:putative glutaredoxin protein [Hordeum vulgare]KAE8813878.1 putative glutaredoxin protein [Hordeum vulgare]